MSHLELVALVVQDYDAAIHFFVDVLRFELVEDTPSLTNDGRSKRWVVVRPSGAETGILLARADGDQQASIVGQQFAGRVGLFLRVDDFETAYQRMVATGVRFVSPPRALRAELGPTLFGMNWLALAGVGDSLPGPWPAGPPSPTALPPSLCDRTDAEVPSGSWKWKNSRPSLRRD